MAVNPFSYAAIGGEITGFEEIIGADDDESLSQLLGILGDDDDDDDDFDVGAVKKRNKLMKRIAAKKMIARAGLQQAQVSNSQGRYLIAGGRATQGGAAGALDVQATVQETFRPQRLVIQAVDNAGAAVNLNTLEITDILCGTRSQLTSLGAVPASLFAADATNQTAGLMFDTVQAGTSLTVRFRTVAANVTVVVGVTGAALR
jgi:hypothetical protein